MLAISGRLNRERPQVSTVAGPGGRRGLTNSSDDTHRSVYLTIDRDNIPESLDLFGFPDPSITSPGRLESIVPTQALYLMNGDFVTAQAQGMASVIQARFDNTNDQVRLAILWAYGRPATSDELQASALFFQEFQPTARQRCFTKQCERRWTTRARSWWSTWCWSNGWQPDASVSLLPNTDGKCQFSYFELNRSGGFPPPLRTTSGPNNQWRLEVTPT